MAGLGDARGVGFATVGVLDGSEQVGDWSGAVVGGEQDEEAKKAGK